MRMYEQVLNPNITGKLPSADISIHQTKNICFSGSCRHNFYITHDFSDTLYLVVPVVMFLLSFF